MKLEFHVCDSEATKKMPLAFQSRSLTVVWKAQHSDTASVIVCYHGSYLFQAIRCLECFINLGAQCLWCAFYCVPLLPMQLLIGCGSFSFSCLTLTELSQLAFILSARYTSVLSSKVTQLKRKLSLDRHSSVQSSDLADLLGPCCQSYGRTGRN